MGAMPHPRRLLSLLLLCLLCLAPHVRADSPLAPALDQILDAPALKGGITGAIVLRVSDGQVLYAHNAEARLIPASNRKLFTAAGALVGLGGSFRFTTPVVGTTKPDADGVLRGDLILHGVGDSSLLTADLDDMAAQVARAGVRRVTGNVIGDGSVFTDGPYGLGWEWDDLSSEEFPQIAGLEVNRGDIAVHVAPGKAVGDAVVVTLDPPTDYVPIVNLGHTAATDATPDCTVERPYDQNIFVIRGTLPVGGKPIDANVPVVDPPRYAATVLRDALARHGVTIEGRALSGSMWPGANVALASHSSVPISDYLALMNKPSDNLLAESLVRALGAVKGKDGSYAGGLAVTTPLLHSLGVDTDAITLVDGSGIGRRNWVTARAVGQLLLGLHQQTDWKALYDSLPIAGVDGTLRSRLKGTRAAGNVHAKTGTLTGVRALSGYLTGAKGDLYAFSLLMNNYPGTARQAGDVQDRFVVYLADNL